jgi:5'(3')-deoxyribonucleotidase
MNTLEIPLKESVVAVDFDDVLLPLVHPLIEYYNANHANGADLPRSEIANFKTYNYLQWFGIPRGDISRIFDEFVSSSEFIDLHRTEPSEECREVIKELSQSHKLVIISARDQKLRERTTTYVSEWFPGCFSGIYLGNQYGENGAKRTKLQIMEQVDAHTLIDDNPDYITQVVRGGKTGILFGDYPWTSIEHHENIHRATEWKDLLQLLN